eukprot:MONOS_16488.1-p1 / transcript=MONOS_16488.1 / gene=MONOS_16488 / organism=Monocercomonoides_exilis_PA203 / gene_product=unspecified product / transcript_product=unspecified product / location=Mono_scaffold01788:257-1435(-) / protein_length=258 / sequence_SO=supercontig / SO=protein_coding / is_pseudo=false
MEQTHSLGVNGTDRGQQEKVTRGLMEYQAEGPSASIGYGGGLNLDNFQVSGSGCIETENGGGKSACVFDCSFTSCSITNNGGGATPYGHDVMYFDLYNVFKSSNNPFYECYTTNTDDKRVCYGYDYTGSSWSYYHTEKKDWLKRGILNRFVAVSGGGEEELCGLDESSACRTIGVAVEKSVIQVSLSVTLMEGNHTSETTTVDIGEKKISVIGTCKEKSAIGTGALSSVGTLFSVTAGQLGLLHMKVDCNSNANPSSP